MSHLELFSLIVREYDPAIEFFVRVLGFDLVEDSPSLTNDGRPKRWVVVRAPAGQTALLLAQADGPEQASARRRGGRPGGTGTVRPRSWGDSSPAESGSSCACRASTAGAHAGSPIVAV